MIDYSLAAGICNLFVIGTTKLIGFHSLFFVCSVQTESQSYSQAH